MKKRMFSLAAVLCFCLLLALPASAAGDYTITDYRVEAVLHADNTVTQTEYITADFFVPKHGIFRSIPELVRVKQETPEGVTMLPYRAKVENLTVEGAPFETESENDFYVIRIGDEDETVTGPVQYKISYTYDIGDDRVEGYDSIFYSLNGPDWDTEIENFSFSLAFETPLPQESLDGLAVYSGVYGDTGNDYIQYTATAQGIEGISVQALPAQSGVTVYARLPEGYFTGERTVSVLPAYLLLALLVPVLVFTLVRAMLTVRRKPVATVEFYPPQGMTSAEVGYIIDGTSDDKDLISLVIWLADKGYITLCEEGDTMTLTRKKPLPEDAPAYLKTFYDGLFAKEEVRNLGKLDEAFARAFTEAKGKLAQHFTGARSLVQGKSMWPALGLPALSIILWLVFIICSGGFVDDSVILFGVLGAVVLLLVLVLRLVMDSRWVFSSAAARIGHVVLVGALGVLGALLTLPLCTSGLEDGVLVPAPVFVPTLLVWATWAGAYLCCCFAPRLVRSTPYALEMAGKLLGLRSFIEKAELSRLQMLVEQDPAYFYHVLSYAYVFGLSDQWVKQFESLAVQPPEWYSGNSVFTYLYLNQMLSRNFSHSLSQLHTISANAGSGKGSGSSGGSYSGGFSGGGFGGGGGGSW